MSTFQNAIVTTAIAGLFAVSNASNAAIVTVYGDNLSFTYDDSTLFGTANVVGDSIFFLPTDFYAESLNGEGMVTANETLSITIEVITDDYEMDFFELQESGDYQLTGSGASVDASGLFGVTSLTKLDGLQPYMSMGTFDAGTLDTVGPLTQWSAGDSVDLAAISGWGSDTAVTVTLENLLSATTSEIGEEAFIQKKFGGVGIIVNPIPVPAAVWLFGSGLLALAGIARRRTH